VQPRVHAEHVQHDQEPRLQPQLAGRKPDPVQSSNDSQTALGFYNSTGTVIVLATGDGLVVAFKQASSAPTVAGSYHGVQLDGSLSDSFTAAQGVSFNLGAASTQINDPITISSGTVNGTYSKSL